MSPKKATPKKSAQPDDGRCNFVFSDGRRCRQFRLFNHQSLCPHHSTQDAEHRQAEITAAELIGRMDDFRSAQAVNHALGKLFSLTAKGRVPTRNAAVLAYIGQLPIQTLAPVRNEIIEAGGTKDLAVIFRDALGIFNKETQDFAEEDSDRLPFASPRQKREKRRANGTESRRARLRDGMNKLVAAGFARESGLQKFEPHAESPEQEMENEEEATVTTS